MWDFVNIESSLNACILSLPGEFMPVTYTLESFSDSGRSFDQQRFSMELNRI